MRPAPALDRREQDAVRDVENVIRGQIGFLINIAAWSQNDQNAAAVGVRILPILRALGGDIVLLLTNIFNYYEREERELIARFARMEAAIRRLDETIPLLPAQHGFLYENPQGPFLTSNSIRDFLESANNNRQVTRVTTQGGWLLGISLGVAGADALFAVIPFLSPVGVAWSMLLIGAAIIARNEISVRPNTINEILQTIQRESTDATRGITDLQTLRDRLNFVRNMRQAITRLMEQQIGIAPGVQAPQGARQVIRQGNVVNFGP